MYNKAFSYYNIYNNSSNKATVHQSNSSSCNSSFTKKQQFSKSWFILQQFTTKQQFIKQMFSKATVQKL